MEPRGLGPAQLPGRRQPRPADLLDRPLRPARLRSPRLSPPQLSAGALTRPMRAWPPIEEPELLARLALDDEEFFAAARKLAAAWGPREYKPELLERALGYPWERPQSSYLYRDGEAMLLSEL